MKLIEQPLLMLRDAERKREQPKREWRWAGPVCAVIAAGFILWLAARAVM